MKNLPSLVLKTIIIVYLLNAQFASAGPTETYRIPELDFNGDCTVDLSDALIGLKVIAGEDAKTESISKIGIKEMIRILRWVAGVINIPEGYDAYEEDDRLTQAGVIPINENADPDNGNSAQRHNFHDAGDEDWVMFCGIEGETYVITADIDEENRCDVILELHDSSGGDALKTEDDGIEGESERMRWERCPADGFYYIRARHRDPNVFGDDVAYSLSVSNMEAPSFPGDIIGDVFDISSKRFRLTQSALDNLREAGIPDNMMTLLDGMKDADYASEEYFLSDLGSLLGDSADTYESEILASAIYFTKRIRHAFIITSAGRSAISSYCHCYFYCLRDYCIYFHPSDPSVPYTLTAYAPGYEVFTAQVMVRSLETSVVDILMAPAGK